jgi:hypothetical protein
MKIHFQNYAAFIDKKLKTGSRLIEIGSNDGTFLKNFNSNKINSFGFEPSSNVANVGRKNAVKTINAFFNFKNASKLKKLKKNTDIICAANAICHFLFMKNPTLDQCLKKLLMTKSMMSIYLCFLSAL